MKSHEPALLDLQNVTVMRGEKVVLENFSLRIRNDEHVAILGQERWDVFELRSMLGIVSNDLMSMCTGNACGRDVVLSGFFSSTRIFPHHTVDPRHRELADAALERLQISHLADHPVAEMSSGEARRVLIARALVHKPRALLFDEPTNSLDVFARHSLRQTMRSLAKAGVGIILVTHDLSDVIPEIERVLLMSNGRIVAEGPKNKMLQPERLEGLFGIRVELARHDGYYHLW